LVISDALAARHRRSRRAAAALVALAVALLSGLGSSLAAPNRSELAQARERLMELEREFELVVERYNAINVRLDSLRARIAATELELRTKQRRISDRQAAAVALARQLYMSGGDAGTLESVLSSASIAEVESRLSYLSSSQVAQTEVFERLKVDRIELERTVARLEAQRAKAQAAEARLAELRRTIETKLASQRDEVSRLMAAIQPAEARARSARAVPDVADITVADGVHPAARRAVEAALSQVGKPYRWGAAGPDSYDCSGLTMWAWAQAGVALPHNSGMQYAATTRVARDDWQPGDLLFFGNPIHHVGMYIGRGQMVEAPYSGTQVRVNSAYRSDYVGAGRPGV
jgi:cell wall-associated NlpC family hydrolase